MPGPYTVIPEGYFQVALVIDAPGIGGEQIVTWGMKLDPGGTNGGAVTSVTDIINDLFVNRVSDAYSLREYRFTFGQPTIPYFTFGVPGGGAGGVSFDDPPPAACVNVAKNASFPGRQGHGRFFWPGLLDENQVGEDGMIDSGARISLQTAFDAVLGLLDDGVDTDGMYLFSRSDSPNLDPKLVFALVVRPQFTWLRSRQH